MLKIINYFLILYATGACALNFWPINYGSIHYVRSNFTPIVLTDRVRLRSQQLNRTIGLTNNRRLDDDQQLRNDRIGHTASIKFNDHEKKVLQEGSFCRRQYDRANGYCLQAQNCRHIYHEYKMFRIKIDICGFNKTIPVVCCPLLERPQKRISAQKCEEYSKIGTISASFIPLLTDPIIMSTTKRSRCGGALKLIVGGQTSNVGEFPHMAAIGLTTIRGTIKWACAGSLISEKVVLTAAHCRRISGVPPNIIRLGEQNLFSTSDQANPQDFGVVAIKSHPLYNPSSYYYDIALIRLNRNVVFSKFIRPACLWQSPELNGTQVVATGWGRIKFQGKKSEELQKVTLDLIDRNTCNRNYAEEKKLDRGIMSNQLCAGYRKGGRDTCQGDSGGPLQIPVDGDQCMHHVVGLTSFGKSCADPNLPGVYTKVYSYLDWIEINTFG